MRAYVDQPPSEEELERVLEMLGLQPWDIARLDEDVAKDITLAARPRERSEWIKILVANPILIERPIVISEDGRAVVGRPSERVDELL